MGQSGLIASIKNSSIYGAFKRGTNSVKQTFYNCIPNKVLEKDTYVNAGLAKRFLHLKTDLS